jgi:hypothetical protein
VLASLIRIVTNPRVFPDATPIGIALKFANQLREHPAGVMVSPGGRHWEIFTGLCMKVGAKGNLVSDAYFAAPGLLAFPRSALAPSTIPEHLVFSRPQQSIRSAALLARLCPWGRIAVSAGNA